MSRIGKKPIPIPKGVKVAIAGTQVNVEGPMGKVAKNIPENVNVVVESEQILVQAGPEPQRNTALLGLSRTLVANMVEGVTKGFQKNLEINGVGYRAEAKSPKVLNLALGYSHPIEFPIPEGITIEVEKQTQIAVKGVDKELVGETAANIRAFRSPEPYKGKGIKYKEERIIRKAGKAGKK
ncbi:MAG: 50S ribosomal protein L6 [Deltaproteobacteria bacterium]|nr:50S ribosomal protein L6 [Deltaproteobacteria bacterium]